MRDLFSRLRSSVRQMLARLQRGGIKNPAKASHVSYAAPRGAVQAAEQPAEPVQSPEAKSQQLQQARLLTTIRALWDLRQLCGKAPMDGAA